MDSEKKEILGQKFRKHSVYGFCTMIIRNHQAGNFTNKPGKQVDSFASCSSAGRALKHVHRGPREDSFERVFEGGQKPPDDFAFAEHRFPPFSGVIRCC